MNIFFLPSIAWIASIIGTALMLRLLTARQVMDNPNERSNHTTPTPRGGGLAMVIVILACFCILGISPRIIIGGTLLLAVSFADDIRSMPASLRFLAQFVAVFISLPALHPLPEAVPPLFIYGFIALGWLWFINLTNFMDGIDGISAMQVIMQMLGIILLHSFVAPLPLWLPIAAGVVAAGALGFLRYNLSPARLFMGDAGSIPLGFLQGFLLWTLFLRGYHAAGIILPAYYLTDATLTLIKRALRGEKVWQAHSQHTYQKAVRAGMTHNAVVLRITLLNALLVTLALLSTHSMMGAVITTVAAYAATYFLVARLSSYGIVHP